MGVEGAPSPEEINFKRAHEDPAYEFEDDRLIPPASDQESLEDHIKYTRGMAEAKKEAGVTTAKEAALRMIMYGFNHGEPSLMMAGVEKLKQMGVEWDKDSSAVYAEQTSGGEHSHVAYLKDGMTEEERDRLESDRAVGTKESYEEKDKKDAGVKSEREALENALIMASTQEGGPDLVLIRKLATRLAKLDKTEGKDQV